MRFITLLIILFLSFSSFAQISFGPETVLTSDVSNPCLMKKADVNNDGYCDIVANIGSEGHDLVWFENLNDEKYSQEKLISSAENFYVNDCFEIFDYDGDEYPDFIFGESSFIKIIVNDNLQFSEELIVVDTLNDIIELKMVDIDGDSDQDIIIIDANSGETNHYAFFNDGTNSFPESALLVSDIVWSSSFELSDIDDDSDLDIVTHSGSWVMTYINDGNTNFSLSQSLQGPETYDVLYEVIDMDNDGFEDLITCYVDFLSYNHTLIKWFRNTGMGNFEYVSSIYSDTVTITDIFIFDFGDDGDYDILGGTWMESNFLLIENTGDQIYESSLIFDFGSGGIYFDFCAIEHYNDQYRIFFLANDYWHHNPDGYYYLNLGNERDLNVYSIIEDKMPVFSLSVADLNVDGYNELLISTGIQYYENGRFGYFNNLGELNFDPPQYLNCFEPYSYMSAFDWDGDLDLDLLGAGDNVVHSWSNWGDEFGNMQVVGQTISNSYTGQIVHTNDLNGDGIMDFVSIVSSTSIGWFKGLGGGEFMDQGIIDIITDPFMASVSTADLDGDNDVDILLSMFGESFLRMYSNEGDGSFNEMNYLTDEVFYPEFTQCQDVDGDGDMDILVGQVSNGFGMKIYENDGFTNFESHGLLYGESIRRGCAADLNGDNLCELIFYNYDSGKIGYIQNLGNGNFSASVYFNEYWQGVNSLLAADINNDGDNEVIVGGQDGKVSYYSNLLYNYQDQSALNQQNYCLYPNPVSNTLWISNLNQSETLEVYNSNGQKLQVTDDDFFDVSSYSRGIYFIIIKNKNEAVLQISKFLKL